LLDSLLQEMLLYMLISLVGLCSCTRPRGVRAELASFYNPGTDFACLDGSGTIPFIQVNDDYCDCDDGSDEPGTSACPNGKFFCENQGHKALVIPSSRVNDGICDCCDGSDEWESGSPCENKCMELGRAAREAALAAARVAQEGFNIKQGMIEEGRRVQEEKMQQISEKETLKTELANKKEELRLAKEAAEAPEKEALEFYRQLEEEENRKKEEEEKTVRDAEAEERFKELDTNQDNVISVEELLSVPGLDTNKDGSVSEEEVKFFLSGHDNFDLERFKTVGFVLLKPYLDLQVSTEAPTEHHDVEEGVTGHPEEGATAEDPEVYDPWRQNQAKEEERDTEDYDDNEEEDEDDEDYDIVDTPAEVPEPSVQAEEKYDENTRGLIAAAEEARKQFQEVERQLTDVEREISSMKDVLEKDYGPAGEFYVLSGQCFEYTDNEYVYKMCPYSSCTQRSKSGGSETRLGGWGEWMESTNSKYGKMKYSGGQQCWNGPARSAIVHLHCGTENVLTTVSEPNRCEYEMHFTTPAACTVTNVNHDEL